MPFTFRLAVPADAARIAEIYAPNVLLRTTSFELVAPDAAAMAERIAATLTRWPWVVACNASGEVQAYAYAGAFAERAAYQWSAMVSVYVADGLHRSGLGRQLYSLLFAVLARQGVVNLLAGITLPNAASMALHQALGFVLVGHYPSVGHKQGAWLDVAHLSRQLPERLPAPPVLPPRPLPQLLASGELADLGLA